MSITFQSSHELSIVFSGSTLASAMAWLCSLAFGADLAAAIASFTALGMTLEGEMPVEGPWVDRVNRARKCSSRHRYDTSTSDGHGRLELTKFRNPKLVEIEPAIAPPNTLSLRSVMFTVESVDDTVARLRANGAELVGEVAQYEDKYRLCYMRGPADIIVALAEELF